MKKSRSQKKSRQNTEDDDQGGIRFGKAVFKKKMKKTQIQLIFINLYKPQKVQIAFNFHSMKLNLGNNNRILEDTRGHKGPHVYTTKQGFQSKWYKFFSNLYKWQIDHLLITSFQKNQKQVFIAKIQKSVPKVYYPYLKELQMTDLRIINMEFIAFINAPVLTRLNLANNLIVHTKSLGKFRRVSKQRQLIEQKQALRQALRKRQLEQKQKQKGKKGKKYNEDQPKTSSQLVLNGNLIQQIPLQKVMFCHKTQSLEGIAHCVSKWQKKWFTSQGDINFFAKCQLQNVKKQANFFPRPYQLKQFKGQRLIPASKKLNTFLTSYFSSKNAQSNAKSE